MDYDVDKVEQNPASLFIAGPAETLQTLFSRSFTDFIGNGAHLSIARAGGDYEIIGGRRFAPQIQSHNIAAMPIGRHLSCGQSKCFCCSVFLLCQITRSFFQ